MRLWILAAAALVAAAAAAPATAHTGDHAEHLSVHVDDLAPGEERLMNLTFEGGPFAAGWVFLSYGLLVSGPGPVLVNLTTPDGEAVANWAWTADSPHLNTTRLPQESEYRLRLSNPHPSEPLRYAFYFDQSCECLDKTVAMPGGWAIFNLRAPADRKILFTMGSYHIDQQAGGPVEPQGVRVEATAARLVGDDGQWPDDFEVVTSASSEEIQLDMEWTTSQADTYYVWVEVVEGASPDRPVLLVPNIRQEAGGASPGLGVFAFLAALVLAALAARATRNP